MRARGVEVTPPKATPPRAIRRDSESDSESDSEPDDDDRSPPVATAATPSTDIDDISRAGTPQSGPRVPDVVPQPRPRAPPSALLTRAVEAAADAVAAAEAAADASFDDAEERLSPQRDADRPVRSISAAPSRAASPAPPRPAGLVRARDDALASILRIPRRGGARIGRRGNGTRGNWREDGGVERSRATFQRSRVRRGGSRVVRRPVGEDVATTLVTKNPTRTRQRTRLFARPSRNRPFAR